MIKNRTLVWFSCGVTSAVAAKMAVSLHQKVVVAYCDVGAEHPDNERFLTEVEHWIGQEIIRLKSKDYEDTWDVFEKTGYLVGPKGARCTLELKKKVRRKFQHPRDLQVFGFDAGEKKRIARFRKENPEVKLWTPLVDKGLTKADCLAILRREGIEIPVMYKLGYKNNNCIGCVKGGAGYWNKIRRDFPDHFQRMAKLERRMGVKICNVTINGERQRIYLDELDPNVGNYAAEPEISCGIACGETLTLISDNN